MKDEPRKMGGRRFLKHVDGTLKYGNRMPIQFPAEPEPVDIVQWQMVESDNINKTPVKFYFSIRPNQHIFLENIDDWVFVQKRPQTEWVAVRNEKGKVLKAPEFYVYANNEIYDKGFQPTLRAEGKNYNILSVSDGPTISQITVFTTRDNSNEVIKWHYEKDAEFQYDWQKDAWEGSPTVRVSTDRKTICETLNLNGGDATVFVSGKGLTFYGSWTNSFLDFDVYVFLSGDEKQYFHSTKGTRLRTKNGGGVTEFHLDHVRRIHVD
nr:MAG TPA: hypothetical protein [Caudoviricetes sp.]